MAAGAALVSQDAAAGAVVVGVCEPPAMETLEHSE